MKKAMLVIILSAMFTACGTTENTVKEEPTAETSAVSQITTNAAETTSKAVSSGEEKSIVSSSSIISKATESQPRSDRVTKTETQPVSESIKADTSHTTVNSSVRHEPTTTTLTLEPVTESMQTVTSANNTRASKKTAAAEKPKAVTTVKATVKREKTADTKVTAKTKTSAAEEETIYVEIEDVTSLETMTKELENSSTPPSYYEKIGKGLKHDGTDYGKARAVYKWMRENGWGSCVYYSMETYFVCKGVGLECAYGFATDNGWYGHTYSVVKVDGIWYVMDTQGRIFLDNINYCTRMFDGNDKDIPRFKEDIWYDYDENGEYRDWSIE